MMSSDISNYEYILMAAGSAESDGCIINPKPDAQRDMDCLVREGYFKPINIARDMSGYALTNKGRTDAWSAWERHKDIRDVLSKL
jgi:hypothetical protein